MGRQRRHFPIEEFGRIDGSRDQLVIAGERQVIGIHCGELVVGIDLTKRHDSFSDDAARERRPVDLRHAPRRPEIWPERRRLRQGHGVMRHAVSLDVIGVPVASEIVVRHDNLRPYLANHLHQIARSGEKICPPKAVIAIVTRHPHHSRVTVLARFPEETMITHAEDRHRVC